MKIGILGSGNMGRSLGTLWAELGHEVFFGSREASRARGVAQAAGHGCQGGTLDEAAAFGAVVLHTARDVLPSAMLSSTAALEGKTLIDCNNGVIPPGFAFETIAGESLTERIAADVPGANVVKAFNTMAQEVFELSPSPLKEHDVSCFVCGEDADARSTAMELAREIGFTPVDCGGTRNARLLEALGDFIRLMMRGMDLGLYATVSVHVLPEAERRRLGGREPSRLAPPPAR